jgi:hypothetical protein
MHYLKTGKIPAALHAVPRFHALENVTLSEKDHVFIYHDRETYI